MTKGQVAAELMKHLVEHNWHGYSQRLRWGDGEGVCPVVVDGKTYNLQQGDRDCSSAIIECCRVAGLNVGNATYTGNMRQEFVKGGDFVWRDMSYVAQKGDIYLNEANHTAMCWSAVPDMLMEFSISEKGTIDGATGDQTGRESLLRAYYDYPWNGILQCVNKDKSSIVIASDDDGVEKTIQEIIKRLNKK